MTAKRKAAQAAVVVGDSVKVMLQGNPVARVLAVTADNQLVVEIAGEVDDTIVIPRAAVVAVNGKHVCK